MFFHFRNEFDFLTSIWYSIFHSVSAFCNAGFDLMGVKEPFSSLSGFSQNALVNITVMLLITFGGIGFLVWNDFREHGLHFKRFRLQSRLVLITSCVMILTPALWFFLFELKQLPPARRILPALFQSVTLRTAGFNTVDLNGISGSGQSLMILWMLVGGSPGSTAGGMKTTTGAVLLMTALAVFRRSDNVHFLGRRISDDTVRNAAAILVMYGSLFFAAGLALCRIEHLPLHACLFETASALGTGVGGRNGRGNAGDHESSRDGVPPYPDPADVPGAGRRSDADLCRARRQENNEKHHAAGKNHRRLKNTFICKGGVL